MLKEIHSLKIILGNICWILLWESTPNDIGLGFVRVFS